MKGRPSGSHSDIVMGKEYRIKFVVPVDYNPANLFKNLPNPIHRQTMSEISNYKIEKDGFYFSDALVDSNVSSVAFRQFVEEALKHSKSIEIVEL